MVNYTLIIPFTVLYSITGFTQNETIKEKCLTNNAFDNRYATYSPNGEWILFESNQEGHWQIYLMDSQGRNTQKLTNKNNNRRPSWHPNGQEVLFESNKNNKQSLYTINIKTKKEKKIPINIAQGEPIFASYSPNGKTIAFSIKHSDNNSNIALISQEGYLIKHLTNNDKRNFYPKWSNDGKEIIYFSRKDTNNQSDEIYRLNIETNAETRLTNWHKHNFCPSWSANNKKIAYVTSMESTRPEIYIMDSNGDNKIRITNNKLGETLPSWHPSKNKIIYTAYRNKSHQICELKLQD